MVAVVEGRKDIVLLLLDRGADINKKASGEYNGTALAVAAFIGSVDISSLLLDRGADINLVGGKYGTALAAAVFSGSVDMVSLLIDWGADINTVGGQYGTALAAAAFTGNMDVVSLLIDRGADINTVGGEYGTALAAAAFRERTQIVKLLLDRGANINVVGGQYGTALVAAVFSGNVDIISLLIDQGADINTVGGEYGTALAAAAFTGSVDVVSLLIDRGADINTVGGEYGTALGAAAFGEREGMASLLMDQGSDINCVIGEFGTVLGLAIHKRSSSAVIALLLEHGADVMHIGGSYSTTLGVYPSAFDVAHSEDDRTLLELLETASRKQNPNIGTDPASNVNVISRPPFPMPYIMPYSALSIGHQKGEFPSLRSLDILPTTFRAGDDITSAQADIPCRKLTEEVLWHSLAALVGLHPGTAQDKHQWIRNDVCYFVACDFDFGLAYAAARVAWNHFNEYSVDSSIISIQRGQWHKHAQALHEKRSKAIKISSGQELIEKPYSIMPRRLWDLKSNRVVDFRMLLAIKSAIDTIPTFWAVSHSWTSDMCLVWTAINQHQWPIPLPKDISLDYLRSELLTLGAEYVWIDVVCLRQRSEANDLEQLRREEWKLDVPTIGNIYGAAVNIVRYFNGLGVHFRNSGWDDSRHWLQRAWTLQEIANENTTINGGIPRGLGQVFLNSQVKVLGKVTKLRNAIRPVIQLAAQVDSPRGCEVYDLVREMIRRHASQPLDKLSGLLYLLRTTKLPCYDDKMSTEDIWRKCFYLLPPERKAEILFDFPYRGLDKQWFPTWAQVLDWPVRDPDYDHIRPQSLPASMRDIEGKMSFFIRNIWAIPDVVIYDTDNSGEYKVKINNRFFGFYLPYLLQEPIKVQDQPIFTLATMELGHTHNWVICRAIGKQLGAGVDLEVVKVNVLKKVGVLRTDFCSELSIGEHGVPLLQKMDCLFV